MLRQFAISFVFDSVNGVQALSRFVSHNVIHSFRISRKFFVSKPMNLYFVLFHWGNHLDSFYLVDFVLFNDIFFNKFLDRSDVSFHVFVELFLALFSCFNFILKFNIKSYLHVIFVWEIPFFFNLRLLRIWHLIKELMESFWQTNSLKFYWTFR